MTAPALSKTAEWRHRLLRRHIVGAVAAVLLRVAAVAGIAALVLLLVVVARDGLDRLSWDFITSYPSRFASQAGIRSALLGSLWVLGLTAAFAVPVGIGAAIYLEEFAPPNWLTRIIETNINNLAGVPSIVYGLLGLALFVRAMELGRSVLAGALTLSLVVLPIVIVSAREGLRTVPPSIREASLALGATRWQTVWHQVLPAALAPMMTGVILALSRAIGETAPLITIGALLFVPFDPHGPLDSFTVLPIQIFNWVSRPQPAFHQAAAAGIIVLLAVLLGMNAIAIAIRYWSERRRQW
ncbi:Phosphate transport system permease protein PstA [bacterium HR24]|nr:Phosphate transport system permease protein PstA [bacterium HR24]